MSIIGALGVLALSSFSACGGSLDARNAALASPCDLSKPFGPPIRLDELADLPTFAALTADELTIVYAGLVTQYAGTPFGDYGVFIAERSSPYGAFAASTGVTVSPNVVGVALSPDGLELFLARMVGDVTSISSPRTTELVRYRRRTRGDSFSSTAAGPTQIELGVSPTNPFLSTNGTSFYFNEFHGRGTYRTLRSDGIRWAPPELLPEVDARASNAVVTRDELTLFYAGQSPSGAWLAVWSMQRMSRSEPFAEPRPLPELDAPSVYAEPRWVSPDGCRIYYWRFPGPTGLFVARRER